MKVVRKVSILLLAMAALLGPGTLFGSPHVKAATPASGTVTLPDAGGTGSISWTGGPLQGASLDTTECVSGVNCDSYTFTLNVPDGYWSTHTGDVKVGINWTDSSQDFDLFVFDSSGTLVGSSTGGTPETTETVDLHQANPGTYTVTTNASTVTAPTSYSGTVSYNTSANGAAPPNPMVLNETKDTITKLMTANYPLNVIFLGYHPSSAEVTDLRYWVPENYQPVVGGKSSGGNETQNAGAGLLNWNKNHLTSGQPYFLGDRFNYDLHIIQASDAYTKALYAVARQNTVKDQTYHESGTTSRRTNDQVAYDATYGKYRLLAKGGDPTYKVADATKHDQIDAYAVEDWIFNSRFDPQWKCAFKDLESGACHDPSIIAPDPKAYYDNYYDKNGLNIDRMPQGVNGGSSVFFMDTFTPAYARDYFRPTAYHTWGTDKVYNGSDGFTGQIRPWPLEDCKHPEGCGSWRITDPDTHGWSGVDFARTWGGRYRFHFFDLGAAPNDYESASWAKYEHTMSSQYPFGDPPIWQYQTDPQWQQTGDNCTADPQTLNYTGGTPCRMMPRLARDVAYDLFFRSTGGYLYRPIPRGDVNWLAVSQWTDYYSHPEWNASLGQHTSAPWYGVWWTDPTKLYNPHNVLRWLSAAEPYVRWIGLPGQKVTVYDPTTNKPTNQVLDASPKYADLPAPQYHVTQSGAGVQVLPEPNYDGTHVVATYGSSQVDLTGLSNAVEKAKANGVTGASYDDSVNTTVVRDYIDAHRAGIADRVPGVNTIPAINMVFEKAYTWGLPAIAGGIAIADANGEAWGVLNNVNDRFGWAGAHFPACPTTGDTPTNKCSTTDQSLPTQQSGTGFSYTIEHEAAHNLGLSHPHDGSYGVDRCTQGPNAGKWECYWSGLGWVMDISAAPTTYAMDYHPYEVEDQDQLQRGRAVEYLIKAQGALSDRLTAEAKAGNTTPSPSWNFDYSRMKSWRSEASALFQCGDYLHAEYAARNASLAAQGVQQTKANTENPAVLEPGQVYYFNVHPQCPDYTPPATLMVSNVTATHDRPHHETIGATVTNVGVGAVQGAAVTFANGQSAIGKSVTVGDLNVLDSKTISIGYDTRGLTGDQTVIATATPNDTNDATAPQNVGSVTFTVHGNQVPNGSFESASNPKAGPDGWTPTPKGTLYDTTGAHATDGKAAVGTTANKLPKKSPTPSWTSGTVPVTAGQAYTFGVSIAGTALSSSPSVTVTFLDAGGKQVGTPSVLVSAAKGSFAAKELDAVSTAPAGASRAHLALTGFAPTDTKPKGTAWFDDVWLDY